MCMGTKCQHLLIYIKSNTQAYDNESQISPNDKRKQFNIGILDTHTFNKHTGFDTI